MMDGLSGLSYPFDCAQAVPARRFAFEAVVDEICALGWERIDAADLLRAAKAYYYFSIQFRENLEVACRRNPQDKCLQKLHEGECNTDNLSPWPGVAAQGERLDHDEFVRRLLVLERMEAEDEISALGAGYLAAIRNCTEMARASSIASYEDGGLSRVFQAMLRAQRWESPGALGFRFFLEQHIQFDSDDGAGHGTLSRHLDPDDSILPLWLAFKDLLVAAVPRLAEPVAPGDATPPLLAAE